MRRKTDPETIALETCRILESQFPHLEISVNDPHDFFDGFFTDIGFPGHCGYHHVWREEGCVIYVEAPQIYWWEEDNMEFKPSDSETPGMAIIFVHKDGHVCLVNDADGSLFQLFPTPHPQVLAEYLKLFFQEGRDDLDKKRAEQPSVTGVYVPFFQFPDDFSDEPFDMPLVPVALLRDTLMSRVTKNQLWLFEMEDSEAEIRKTLAEGRPEESSTSIEFFDDTGSGTGPMSVWDFSLACDIRMQREREKNRPELMNLARTLSAEDFLRHRNHLHSSEWFANYGSLGGGSHYPPLLLPIMVTYNDRIFAPLMIDKFYQKGPRAIYSIVIKHIKGEQTLPFTITTELPPYRAQVENCFLQTVLTHQAPILAKRAMKLSTDPEEAAASRLEKRRVICQKIRELLSESAEWYWD